MRFKIFIVTAITIFPFFAFATNVGKRLICFPSYQVNYKLFPNEAGLIHELSLTDSMEGILRSTGGLIGGIEVDLDRMNEWAVGGWFWQYARLLPAREHSDRPIDIGFGPVYGSGIMPRNPTKMQINIGHAKSDKFEKGLFQKPLTGLDATISRMASTPYDDVYFSEVTVEVDLTPNNFVEITLPSVHAGLRHIELECSVR